MHLDHWNGQVVGLGSSYGGNRTSLLPTHKSSGSVRASFGTVESRLFLPFIGRRRAVKGHCLPLFSSHTPHRVRLRPRVGSRTEMQVPSHHGGSVKTGTYRISANGLARLNRRHNTPTLLPLRRKVGRAQTIGRQKGEKGQATHQNRAHCPTHE